MTVVVSGTEVFAANDSGISSPKFEHDSRFTYIGFKLPPPSGGSAVDGQITLRYTVRPDIQQFGGLRRFAEAPGPPAGSPRPSAAGSPHPNKHSHEEEGSWRAVLSAIRDPATRQGVERALATHPRMRPTSRPHTARLAINPVVGIHKPVAGPAAKGVLTPGRVRADATRQKAKKEQIMSVLDALREGMATPMGPPKGGR